VKSTIHAEYKCGECGGMMQYHENSTKLRCTKLKCSQRNIEYLVPTIELEPVNKPVKKNVKQAAKN
jgi:DNA-directed RNA polymerase subunit RPC12/RpoP